MVVLVCVHVSVFVCVLQPSDNEIWKTSTLFSPHDVLSSSSSLGEGSQRPANLQWHSGLCSEGVAG